jgi:hypothetical protein
VRPARRADNPAVLVNCQSKDGSPQSIPVSESLGLVTGNFAFPLLIDAALVLNIDICLFTSDLRSVRMHRQRM